MQTLNLDTAYYLSFNLYHVIFCLNFLSKISILYNTNVAYFYLNGSFLSVHKSGGIISHLPIPNKGKYLN